MKTIIRSIFTLSAFTFIERVLGFFFKIYLSRELGAAALGIYQVALSFFLVLLTFTTSGIPLIVSKHTAKCRAEYDLCDEGSIATAALVLGLIVSAATALVVLLLQNVLGGIFADRQSARLVVLMLPALIFSSVYSAFRGNLWGRQKYTAVSSLELIEQIARVIFCAILFALGVEKLATTAISLSLATLVSAAICATLYFSWGGSLRNPKKNFVPLFKNSMPVTLARASSSIVTSLTSIVVPMLLISGGMNASGAMYEYGYSAGMALPLLYIPLTFVGSMAFVMIPTLSSAHASKNEAGIIRQIEKATSMAIVLGGIFVPSFMALGKDAGVFIYDNADAGKFLTSCAWLMLPISLENITSSMMNSLDLEFKGLLNYCIGSVGMFALFFISGKEFNVNIMAIGMGVSFTLSSVLNLLSIRKKHRIRPVFLITLLKTAMLGIPAYFISIWTIALTDSLGMFFKLAISGIVGFGFMLVGSFLFGTLKIEYFFSTTEKRKKKPALHI